MERFTQGELLQEISDTTHRYLRIPGVVTSFHVFTVLQQALAAGMTRDDILAMIDEIDEN